MMAARTRDTHVESFGRDLEESEAERAREELRQQREARELRRFFQEYSAEVGFSSTFSVMLAALEGIQLGTGPRAGWDPYAERVDKIGTNAITHAAIQRMPARHALVLMRLYDAHGPADSAMTAAFGELAPVAALTVAAGEARDEHVYRETREVEESTAEDVAVAAAVRLADCHEIIATTEKILAAWERKLERTKERVAYAAALRDVPPVGRPFTPGERETLDWAASNPARVVGIERRIAKLKEGLQRTRGLVESLSADDGSTRARIGTITAADRRTSAEDALRARLVYGGPRQPNHKPDPDAYGAWDSAKSILVAAVTAEAKRRRRAAHASYREARSVVLDDRAVSARGTNTRIAQELANPYDWLRMRDGGEEDS